MATELALTKPDPTMNEESLRVLMAAAQRYVQSGLLPAEVNTPQKALVIMTAGRELGIPATYALRNIHVVKGKPVCSAELLLALVRRSYGPGAMRVGKTSNTACTVQYREQGWDGISEYTFTIEDARQAGVANGGSWKSYPAAMLRARCISAVVRFAFPECIAGLYTPEEMGAEVVVTDEGHVNVVDSASPAAEIIEPTEPLSLRDRQAARLIIEGGEVVKSNGDPAAVDTRAKLAEQLVKRTQAALALGIDVDVLNPDDLNDTALLETVRALGEMIANTRAALAAQQQAPAPADDDMPF